MTRHSRKRERSQSPPKPSNKRRRLSPSIEETRRHTRSTRPRAESPHNRPQHNKERTNRRSRTPSPPLRVHVSTFKAASRRVSPVRPKVQSTIHRPSPIRAPERRVSPVRLQQRRASPVRAPKRKASPIRMSIRRESPIRLPRQRSPIVEPRHVSPVRAPPVQVSNRQLGLQMKAQRKIGSVKNPLRQEAKIYVLKLDDVSNKIALSRLIHELVVETGSIIGCHRVADYDAKIQDGIVFLYLTSEKEFKDLLSRDFLIIDGCMIAVTDPELIYGQAKYTIPFGTASDYDMRMSPHPIGIFGFRQLPSISSFFVVAVLKEFEQEGTVTGFKLAFCERRQLTRNFGFVTFLNRISAFKVYGRQFNILGDIVEAKLPDGMPFLISKDREHLVANHRCELTEEIRAANWLNVNFLDPAVPLRPIPYGETYIPPNSNPPIQPVNKPQVKPRCSVAPNVIRHNTPPASPALSIGQDYEIDEDGILAVPSTFWLDAGAD